MSGLELGLIGGVWLSLLYCAAVMPATVWPIQLAVSRGWGCALAAAAGLLLGQLPWALAAALALCSFPSFWQAADLPLRAATAAFLVWMAVRSARSAPVPALRLQVEGTVRGVFSSSLWRSLLMPWRLPLWAAFIISVGVHLRGPGPAAAAGFALGSAAGQAAWHGHFILLAALFGHRVPEDISIRSMNKLRLLATLVLAGLAFIIVLPVVVL